MSSGGIQGDHRSNYANSRVPFCHLGTYSWYQHYHTICSLVTEFGARLKSEAPSGEVAPRPGAVRHGHMSIKITLSLFVCGKGRVFCIHFFRLRAFYRFKISEIKKLYSD